MLLLKSKKVKSIICYLVPKMQNSSSSPEMRAHQFLEYFCLSWRADKYSEYELYQAFGSWCKQEGIKEQERCKVLSAAYSMLAR
jgi:hypothetical protein